MRQCDTCNKEWPEDRFRDDCPAPDTCFKCRASGVSLTLQGGKQYWNEDTERRRADRAIAEATKAGFEPVPAETGKAYNGASAGSLAKIGEISKKNGAFGKKAAQPAAGSAGNTSKTAIGTA